jgi:hypothetical protein
MLKRSLVSLLAALTLAVGFLGCERGPAEKAGRELDRAGERTRDTINDTGDRARDALRK